MFGNHEIRGEVHQYDEPDWQALYDLVGVELADWFMWMCEVELDDGVRMHAYKHIATRRYFHLAVDGRAFVYLRRSIYREIDRRQAIDLVFERWQEMCADDERDATRAALRRARRAETMRAHRARDEA